MPFLSWNGNIIPQEHLNISPDNRSFRYGDGCFETIKVVNGNIILHDLHFYRLISSLVVLMISIPDFFTKEYFTKQILQVINANKHVNIARVRMTLFRKGEGLKFSSVENSLQFIVQSWNDEKASNTFNKIGLSIDIYKDAKKTCDVFSNLKSNNYLPYIMGKLWAESQKLDECLLTNTNGSIADATVANIFIVENGIIKTPSLSEGCVDGTMRKYLLQCFKKEKIQFEETTLTEDNLLKASEVFLTNAIYGIKWVDVFRNKHFENKTSTILHHTFIRHLFFLKNN